MKFCVVKILYFAERILTRTYSYRGKKYYYIVGAPTIYMFYCKNKKVEIFHFL